MDKLSATDIVLILGAVGLLLKNTIDAWRASSKADINQAETKAKLEEIHFSTNGNLSKLEKKIDDLEKKAITDTANVVAMQEIVKNLTDGSSVNVVKIDKK